MSPRTDRKLLPGAKCLGLPPGIGRGTCLNAKPRFVHSGPGKTSAGSKLLPVTLEQDLLHYTEFVARQDPGRSVQRALLWHTWDGCGSRGWWRVSRHCLDLRSLVVPSETGCFRCKESFANPKYRPQDLSFQGLLLINTAISFQPVVGFVVVGG